MDSLLKSHDAGWGIQFAEFLEAWQVEELDPDRVDCELHIKVATVSKGYSPFTSDVL